MIDPAVALRDRWERDAEQARERGDHRAATWLANQAEALTEALEKRTDTEGAPV